MAVDLAANCRLIAAGLEKIAQRAPSVADGYRLRLEERLKKNVGRIPGLARSRRPGEGSEPVRRAGRHLRGDHPLAEPLGPVRRAGPLPESAGRKLEFLTQEMFREANTIGSKANDVEITADVIEVKSAIERIREMIQNVE